MRMLPHERFPEVLYFLFLYRAFRGNPGPGGSGSVIVQYNIQTHAACIMWLKSMALGSAYITNNVVICLGLVQGL